MRGSRTGVEPGVVIAIGFFCTAAWVGATLLLMDSSSYDVWGAMFIGPLLFAVTLPILARVAAREGDRRLFWLLVLALVLKAAATLVRYYLTFHVYGGGDAGTYYKAGVAIADHFRHGNFDTGLPGLAGTQFISFLTGLVFTVIGPTKLGGFLFFSWLSFIGMLFFYRAFVIAVPEGRTRSYAHLLFFFPTLLYWPSSIGKESFMIVTLGLASYGAAQALSGKAARGLAMAIAGLWLAAVVRPHVAGMLAIGMVGGFLLLRPRESWRHLAPVVKLAGLAAAVGLAAVLVVKTEQFLGESDLSSVSGVVEQLQEVSEGSDYGGSEFRPIIVRSPAQVPLAVVTVLFRPFPTEATNAQSLGAAVESLFLMVLSLLRLRWIWAAVKSVRRQPYVAMAIVYAGLFVIAFASFPNFGLLARERAQLLPLYFILLSIRLRRRDDGAIEDSAAAIAGARAAERRG